MHEYDHHDHGHRGQHNHDHHYNSVEGHLRFGIFLNLAFAILEVVIGVLSNSIAILTDAVHDFADSGSLLISLGAAKISKRQPDEARTFGYKRASILAALLNASLLLVATGFVFFHAIKRLFQPAEVASQYMFVVAGPALW